jgi:hypothetical protein
MRDGRSRLRRSEATQILWEEAISPAGVMRRASPGLSGIRRSWLTRADRDTQIKSRLLSLEPESRSHGLHELSAVDAELWLPGP